MQGIEGSQKLYPPHNAQGFHPGKGDTTGWEVRLLHSSGWCCEGYHFVDDRDDVDEAHEEDESGA